VPLKSSIKDDRPYGRCQGWQFSSDFAGSAWKKNAGQQDTLWKLPQLWKSIKVAFGDFFLDDFHELLGKASAKNASAFPQLPQRRRRLSYLLKQPGGSQTQDFFYSPGSCCRSQRQRI
jgi:hypothetical protein